MPKDDYLSLQHMYLLMKQRADDLQEQLTQKNEMMAARETSFKHTEDLIRELCNTILAKDKKEMVLGKPYSWGKVPVDELISKAIKSYKERNLEKARILSETLDLAEERRMQAESLAEQISQIMQSGNIADPDSVKQAIKDASDSKGADSPVSPNVKNNVQVIVEEDKDAAIVVDGEMRNISEMCNIAEDVALTASAIPTVHSKKKNQRIESEREKAAMAHVVDLKIFMDKMSDVMWDVLYAIGTEGCTRYSEIEAEVLKKNGEDFRKSKIRIATTDLVKMKLINVENVKLPLSPRTFLHWLSDIGKRIYKAKYGKQPVTSLVEKVIAEHDNVEHGFGILDIEKVLNDKGIYKSISSWNRANPIPIENGRSYIPDLICKREKYTEYIEYERGFHTQSDFNAKCNKMSQVTRFLNFVVPNKDVLKHVSKQIDAWVEKRGLKSVENLHVRITTAIAIRDVELGANSLNWLVEYDFKKGAAPIRTPDDF